MKHIYFLFMKGLYQVLASFLIIAITFTNSVSAKVLSRDSLFSEVTYAPNQSVLSNPWGLWRVATQGDRITSFTSSKAISNISKGKTALNVFTTP